MNDELYTKGQELHRRILGDKGGNVVNRAVVAGCCACMTAALIAGARAQSYPAKPIRFMVGFAAGGATDVSARMLSQRLAESLGQSMVVENRPGSGGLIATEAVSKSPADGYTLLMMPAADAVQPALRRKLPRREGCDRASA